MGGPSGAVIAVATMATCSRAISRWSASPRSSRLPSLSTPLTGGFLGGQHCRWRCRVSKNCRWHGVLEKNFKNSRALPSVWPQPICRSGSDVAAEVARVPILDRDEHGNIYLREVPVNESFKPIQDNSSSSAVSKIGKSASKSNANRETKIGSGKLPSSTTNSPSVKVNLPSLSPKARRLAGAKGTTQKGAPLYSKAARRYYNEKFRAEPQRLSKVLAAAGVASRRACEEVIFEGRVTVNGSVCKVPQEPVDALKDIIYVDGRSLPRKMAPKLYFALNKPKGYICSAGAEGTKPILSLFDDYLKIWIQRNPGLARPRMFTVGRLDVATSGLLLVTNDARDLTNASLVHLAGEFAQKVSHPSSGLTKEYVVTSHERATRKQLQVIANGTSVEGVLCVPNAVEPMPMEAGEARQRIRIVVSEGRNHEVRHLVENSGLQVIALKRTRIGGLRLSRKLGIGQFETLTEARVQKVLNKDVQDQV